MKIYLLAESSAGHLKPALVYYQHLIKAGYQPQIISIDKAFPHKFLGSNAIFLPSIRSWKDYRRGEQAILKEKPEKTDIFLSFGGRLTILLIGLYYKGYKNLYTYELNAVLGRSNKLALPFVKELFCYFPLKYKKAKTLGSPLSFSGRKNYLSYIMKKILILTGSLGSKELFQLFDKMQACNKDLDLTISVGNSDYEFKSSIKRIAFVKADIYQDYDLIIARSGAGTIADIISYKVPAFFLPSKNVKDDHQLANAKYIFDKTGAYFLDYKDQTEEKIKEVMKCLSPFVARKNLIDNYSKFATLGAIDELDKRMKIEK